jgi:hypothetical protein
VNGYLLHQSAPVAPLGTYVRPEAISPQHTRTATVFTRILERLPPILAEKYVLPWAGGTPRIDRLCSAITSAATNPASWVEISQARAGDLAGLYREAMRQAWWAGSGGSMFEDAAQRAVEGLTGEHVADCLAVLASARPIDLRLATRLLAVVVGQADGSAARGWQAAQRWLPFLASTVQACGKRVPAYPAVPGVAVGRLVHYGSNDRAAGRHEGAILLVDHPLPPHAPLLLGARGVIMRAEADPCPPAAGIGPGVPTVTGCRPEITTGDGAADGSWLAAIDGASGEVALLAR